MEAGLVRDTLTVLSGVGSGVLSAAFGVGGAVVSTPAVRALGLSPLLAVGTTLPSIFPSAVSGTLRYRREQLVLWRVVAVTCPPGIVAAVAGSMASHRVPGEGHLLMVMTALLLGYTAIRTARGRDEPVPGSDRDQRRERPLLYAGVGTLAGFLSGLLGVGGGVVLVPGFSAAAKLPLKTAIATSLACVAILAVPSTVTHAFQGDIDWRVALLLTLGVIPGARLGAAATVRASDARLRIAVALGLGAIATLYLVGEASALWSSG
ncbi:MAG: sulfite exporter TauE/SafE family protein [Actinobacteria bacterium]|nr:sulfite exporter TauE/SafE family protein [Actinomycetota bacterium]MBW3650538.1 sulfite exporter TauE/SafE family protein [Actinomycetota bacterium]